MMQYSTLIGTYFFKYLVLASRVAFALAFDSQSESTNKASEWQHTEVTPDKVTSGNLSDPAKVVIKERGETPVKHQRKSYLKFRVVAILVWLSVAVALSVVYKQRASFWEPDEKRPLDATPAEYGGDATWRSSIQVAPESEDLGTTLSIQKDIFDEENSDEGSGQVLGKPSEEGFETRGGASDVEASQEGKTSEGDLEVSQAAHSREASTAHGAHGEEGTPDTAFIKEENEQRSGIPLEGKTAESFEEDGGKPVDAPVESPSEAQDEIFMHHQFLSEMLDGSSFAKLSRYQLPKESYSSPNLQAVLAENGLALSDLISLDPSNCPTIAAISAFASKVQAHINQRVKQGLQKHVYVVGPNVLEEGWQDYVLGGTPTDCKKIGGLDFTSFAASKRVVMFLPLNFEEEGTDPTVSTIHVILGVIERGDNTIHIVDTSTRFSRFQEAAATYLRELANSIERELGTGEPVNYMLPQKVPEPVFFQFDYNQSMQDLPPLRRSVYLQHALRHANTLVQMENALCIAESRLPNISEEQIPTLRRLLQIQMLSGICNRTFLGGGLRKGLFQTRLTESEKQDSLDTKDPQGGNLIDSLKRSRKLMPKSLNVKEVLEEIEMTFSGQGNITISSAGVNLKIADCLALVSGRLVDAFEEAFLAILQVHQRRKTHDGEHSRVLLIRRSSLSNESLPEGVDAADIRACDYILIPYETPVEAESQDDCKETCPMHYTLGVIDRKERRIRIVDSAGARLPHHTAVLEDLTSKANIMESIALASDANERGGGTMKYADFAQAKHVPEVGFPVLPWKSSEDGVLPVSAHDGSGVALLENIMSILDNTKPVYTPEDVTALSLHMIHFVMEYTLGELGRKGLWASLQEAQFAPIRATKPMKDVVATHLRLPSYTHPLTGTVIFQDELASLLPGSMGEMSLITEYFKLVQLHADIRAARGEQLPVLLLDPQVYYQAWDKFFKTGSMPEVIPEVDVDKFSNSTRVILPLCVPLWDAEQKRHSAHPAHYILIVMDRLERTVYIVDTLPQRHPAYYERMFGFAKSVAESWERLAQGEGDAVNYTLPTNLSSPGFPVQAEAKSSYVAVLGNACLPMLLENALCLAEGRAPNLSAIDVVPLRTQIMFELTSGLIDRKLVNGELRKAEPQQ